MCMHLDLLAPVTEAIKQWSEWKQSHEGRSEANELRLLATIASWERHCNTYREYLHLAQEALRCTTFFRPTLPGFRA
jgi:hypothetical protein